MDFISTMFSSPARAHLLYGRDQCLSTTCYTPNDTPYYTMKRAGGAGGVVLWLLCTVLCIEVPMNARPPASAGPALLSAALTTSAERPAAAPPCSMGMDSYLVYAAEQAHTLSKEAIENITASEGTACCH